MAEIFSAGPVQVPVTPTKSSTIVQATELTPEYTPAPKYTPGQEPLFEAQASSKPEMGTTMMPPEKEHPVLPVGNVEADIRNHVSCHSIYNLNIDTLLREHAQMKLDLDKSQRTVSQLERELIEEKSEKEAYKAEAEELRGTVIELVYDLNQVRSELTITEDKLASAVKQLMDVASRLEDVKAQLREAVRKRDALTRELAAKEVELVYSNKRINELEIALEVANKGENDANDRNVRLTQMLYEVERQRAWIERAKDQAEALVRNLRDQLNKGIGRNPAIIAELRVTIASLEMMLAKLKLERDAEQQKMKADAEMIKALEADLKIAHTYSADAWALLGAYMARAQKGLYDRFKDLHSKKTELGKPPGQFTIQSVDYVSGGDEVEAKDDEAVTANPVVAEPAKESGATTLPGNESTEAKPAVDETTEKTATEVDNTTNGY